MGTEHCTGIMQSMSTLSIPKSALRDPSQSAIRKFRQETGCDDDSRECIGYRDEPHEHLIETGYSAPVTRDELRALWVTLHPNDEVPADDDIDNVIASSAGLIDAGPRRYFHAL